MSVPYTIALDPGGTTGWMTYNPYASAEFKTTDEGQFGPGAHHRDLWSFLDVVMRREADLLIICESFEYRNSLPKAELVSVEYIGVLKLFVETYSHVKVVWQTASMGKLGTKSFVKQTNLERLGMWKPGMIHAMDAISHFVYYVIHGGNPAFAELRPKLLQIGWKK